MAVINFIHIYNKQIIGKLESVISIKQSRIFANMVNAHPSMRIVFSFLLLILSSTCSQAQIPNGAFEVWDSAGSYIIPHQWDNINALTAPDSIYTCLQGRPGVTDSFYLRLASASINSMSIRPGIAVCGVLDTATLQAKSGFAFNQRPEQLQGNWQYMAFGNDQGYIEVLLTKWDTAMIKRDTIALTKYELPFMLMTWAPFAISLNYLSSSNPDTCIITLSSSGNSPVNGSYLDIDNLTFGDSSTDVKVMANAFNLNVYPNPATENIHISYTP